MYLETIYPGMSVREVKDIVAHTGQSLYSVKVEMNMKKSGVKVAARLDHVLYFVVDTTD